MKKATFAALTVGIASLSAAQSMNIDFNWNGVGTIPNAAYAGAGLAGNWNNANVSTNTIVNLSLFNLSGGATSTVLNVPSFGGNCATSGPWSGGDESLMEDLIGSGSGSVQIAFSGLLAGSYDVILYGMNSTGNSNSAFTINNVTQTTGGAWSGSHVFGASYTQFNNVLVTGGNMAINFTGNNNGIQLRYSPVPEPVSMLALLGGISGFGIKRLRRRAR